MGDETNTVNENVGANVMVSDLSDEDLVIQFCLQNKIAKPAIDELVKRGFNSLEALSLVDPSDIVSPKIPKGQRRLILHIAGSLRPKATPAHVSPGGVPSTEGTAIGTPVITPGGVPSTEGTANGGPSAIESSLAEIATETSDASRVTDAATSGRVTDTRRPDPPVPANSNAQANGVQQIASNNSGDLYRHINNLVQGQQTLLSSNVQTGNSIQPSQVSWNDPQIHLSSAADSRPGRVKVDGSPFSNLSSATSEQNDALAASLDSEVNFYRSNTFAASTFRTYAAQKMAYFEFCSKMSITPIPLSQEDLGRYVAYLSRKLCFTSVRQYLNIVRILHIEAGKPNPLEGNWYVSSILKGVRRVKGDTSTQKMPITLEILCKIFTKLDLSCSFDRCFWSACLVAFYSFFRKSNLLIPSIDVFDPLRHLCASDVHFAPEGAILSVRWSKVIQFQERTLQIPLPRIPDSVFCPSNALLGLFIESPTPPSPVPLFRYNKDNLCLPLTQTLFTSRLHAVLTSLGFPHEKFSNHSFRRGGASYALHCGLPVDLIKLQGDWKSNACERYLEPSFRLRQQVAQTMGKATSTFFQQ